MILAADIGGTNARFALCDVIVRDGAVPRGGIAIRRMARFATAGHESIESALISFLSEDKPRLDAACFGVAGLVRDERVTLTNGTWVVDAATLRKFLGLERVTVVNDVEANAWGVLALPDKDLSTVLPGSQSAGNRVIVSAGTGLGVAGIAHDERGFHPFATEAGHADFAPSDELQWAIWPLLREHFGRVSIERVLSGPGLFALYKAVRSIRDLSEVPDVELAFTTNDPASVITSSALLGVSPLCGAVLDLFVSIYGATAGNLALTMMATGGVYLGGGIVPRIRSRLAGETFARAFTSKGPMTALVQRVPVHAVLEPNTALIGAAACASLQPPSQGRS